MADRSLAKLLWYNFTQWTVGGFGRLYFGVRTRHLDRLPATGPVVVVANHQSHLDPPLVGCYCRRPLVYLARDTLFRGLLGPLIRSYDTIPIDREGTGLAGIRATLKQLKAGRAVLMFPEGTRSPDGQLQTLRPGFCALVRRGGAAMLPVAIDGAYRAMPRGKLLPRPQRIAVVAGERMSPEEVASYATDDELVAEVERRLRAALAEAQQVTGH